MQMLLKINHNACSAAAAKEHSAAFPLSSSYFSRHFVLSVAIFFRCAQLSGTFLSFVPFVVYACLPLIGVPTNNQQAEQVWQLWQVWHLLRLGLAYWASAAWYCQANFNLATKQSKLLTAMRCDWLPQFGIRFSYSYSTAWAAVLAKRKGTGKGREGKGKGGGIVGVGASRFAAC